MSIRMLIDPGEHRIVTGSSRGPIDVVVVEGPGAVVIEGEVRLAGSAWSPADHTDAIVVSTLADEPCTVEVR